MALILQIPPVDPSTSLRTFYLLRLTGDVVSSIPGYHFHDPPPEATPSTPDSATAPQQPTTGPTPPHKLDMRRVRDTLRDLLDFLDDLDQAWLTVLKGEPWDPESASGTGYEFDLDRMSIDENHGAGNGQGASSWEVKTTLPSQTDVTRLRSLLMGGESTIEEWLLNEKLAQSDGQGDEENDLTAMLGKVGLLEEFDNIFTQTMDFLGGFSEDKVSNALARSSQDDEDDDDEEELPMACDFKVLQ